MKRVAALICAFVATPAVAGGDLDTLVPGNYVCEIPDQSGVSRGTPQPAENFNIVNASSYRKNGTIGSYLLIGDQMVLTSGTREGDKYRRTSRGTLHRLGEDGRETGLRCTVANRNNS